MEQSGGRASRAVLKPSYGVESGEDLVGVLIQMRVLAPVPAVDEGADLDGGVADGGDDAVADSSALDDAEPHLDCKKTSAPPH